MSANAPRLADRSLCPLLRCTATTTIAACDPLKRPLPSFANVVVPALQAFCSPTLLLACIDARYRPSKRVLLEFSRHEWVALQVAV